MFAELSGDGCNFMVTLQSGEMTVERVTLKCGHTGVTIMASSDGSMTGPPADILYEVEPVEVAVMTPSPRQSAYSSPLSDT